MQNRQQIRNQLGILEEKLEELGALACANERSSLEPDYSPDFRTEILLQDAYHSMDELNRLVHDQQLFRSVPAAQFLQKISSILVTHASAENVDIAISHFGEGSISMEIAELVMGAIVSGFRACLRGQKSFPREKRVEHHLFLTGTIYLEVRASAGEMLFRLMQDGKGFGSSDFEIGAEKQFQKLRDHIARCGGWFGYSSLGTHGGLIEFKVPIDQNRSEALVISQGSFEALIPSSCVAEISQSSSGRTKPWKGSVVLHPDEKNGLVSGGQDFPVLLRIGVADLKFWIGCQTVSPRVKARRISAEGFVEDGSWLKNLGVFQEDGAARSLPFLDGQALVFLHRKSRGDL